MNTHDTIKAMLASLLLLVGMSEADAGQPYKTGQQSTWDEYGNTIYGKGTGQDGEHQKGKIKKKRFKLKRKKGYIYDQHTHLKWYHDPSCLHEKRGYTWTEALELVKDLNQGIIYNDHGNCSTRYKDWRLPNVKEAQTLQGFSINNERWHMLNKIATGSERIPIVLWTGTSCADRPTGAFEVMLDLHGLTWCQHKYHPHWNSVWPVRGGK